MILGKLILNTISLIGLLFGLYFALKIRKMTEKISPAWLFISVGLVFLAIYALSNVIEFACEPSGVLLFGEPIGAAMDRAELALVPAGAAFLAAACWTLKYSMVKPTK